MANHSEMLKSARPEKLDPILHRVRRAVVQKDRAQREYRAALQAARDAGFSGSQIGAAAGIRKQAVLQLTVPPREIMPPLDAGAPAEEKIRRLRAEVGYD